MVSKDEKGKSELIHHRQKEYLHFLSNPLYRDVFFNEDTGALRATHVEHHFDNKKGYYEEEVTNILFQNGNKIILESEKNVEGVKTPDGTLNDFIFEIKSVEGIGGNNIKNKLNEARSQGCSHVVLYFPDSSLFTYQRLKEAYNRYMGVVRKEKLTDILRNIWVVVESKIFVFK